MSEKLTDIIRGLIKSEIPSPKELRRGLILSYRDATPDNPRNRLLCYRNGQKPSPREMQIVVRDLQSVVPDAQIGESGYWTWKSERGLVYGCYTLSWFPPDGFVQATLFQEQEAVSYE